MKAAFTYEVKNNKVCLNIEMQLKKLLLDKKDFELWNETIKKLKPNYSETVILIEK